MPRLATLAHRGDIDMGDKGPGSKSKDKKKKGAKAGSKKNQGSGQPPANR
jgi:hypothetical protein